jgi:hypothetical protein
MQLSEEKSVKTTINIKKENNISAGRVINIIGIAFFSRLNSLKKNILFFNFSIK